MRALSSGAFVAFIGNKNITAYAAIHAILNAGKAYLPVNPAEPLQRADQMLRNAGADQLVVAPDGVDLARKLLRKNSQIRTIYIIESDAELEKLESDFPEHVFIGPHPRDTSEQGLPPLPKLTDPAYLIHTSGSTGAPKAVEISHANLAAYVHNLTESFPIFPEDRVAQAPDLNFDLSVHDLFITWCRGACLVSISESERFAPGKLISDTQISVWTSVPSVIRFMRQLRMLKNNAFPSIRLTFFCGEPLDFDDARGWITAAPSSRLINLYGPTETTVAIAWHEVTLSDTRSMQGVVPIGRPFRDQRALVIDSEGNTTDINESGELYLSGTQVSRGYRGDDHGTSSAFLALDGKPGVWYRTGDIVRRDFSGELYFVGRRDTQIKLNGYRIELGEVEQAIQAETGFRSVVILTAHGKTKSVKTLVAFVQSREESVSESSLEDQLAQALPKHMLPSEIRVVAEFPITRNGKTDRRKLEDHLDNG